MGVVRFDLFIVINNYAAEGCPRLALNLIDNFKKRNLKIMLLTFNEEDIPYEKRICLLKAPDYVKSKAMDKYKEVHKSNDNSAKSQQYLDGLLNIPFGIYKKEYIICFLDNFKIHMYKFRQ